MIVTNRLQASTNVFTYDYLSSFWTENVSQIKGILGLVFFLFVFSQVHEKKNHTC